MPVIYAAVHGQHFPEAVIELGQQWPDFEHWILDPSRDFDYGDWLREAWDGKDDLVMVEQDVIPPPNSIRTLLGCRGYWCAHPIWLGDHYDERTLSLVKFSKALQFMLPDLAASALPKRGSERPRTHWRSVDQAIIRALEFWRLKVHVHRPPARHLHRYPESPPAGPAPATPEPPA